ncbi:iron-sulfur cluster biosynthesis family protein [Lactococcus taiwanensis]|uniref:iron-sulfur cluster biosynthesis family protein n=1 Tax=Lactococcus taiwanensis TaxID=1151742 RepID=UPI001964ED34|nr:iron-sulfur cluster biosynthesis family protein [Lactococcus taiwanensis]QRZ11946.1 iron-sulfur cluster biosynthesis family protein [Lactococcus taiwanensis]
MEITFDETVTKRLLGLMGFQDKKDLLTKPSAVDFVLDFDHTLSSEQLESTCCGITRYRIVAVEKGQVPPIFDGQISSSLGPFYCKKWGMMYFDETMNVRLTANHLIEIMGRGEQIAPHIEIVDYRKQAVLTR